MREGSCRKLRTGGKREKQKGNWGNVGKWEVHKKTGKGMRKK